ncbi:MAG TPA: nucleotidyltransferase domain-containing protein [Burkholderiaceae bacterium]|nr:nucleotidyltransferase domain-containing protein [Burkholderiaceae bacterium]
MSKPIIEALFGTGAKSKVMQWLYLQESSEPIAARALAREAGVPYGSIDKTLRELVDSQLVVREETRYGPQYRAPHDDPRLAGLFLLLRQDSAIIQQLKRALKPIRGLVYACVFGSFAAGQTRKDSDIDVLVLGDADLDRFAVLAALGKVGDKVSRDVNPQFYTAPEFQGKLADGDPVARSILAHPRIELKGVAPWQT